MKIILTIARVLLGLIFFLFGLNGFIRFLPIPVYYGAASVFISLLITTRFIFIVKALEVVGGALLLTNRYIPLALTLLGPVVVNIFIFHWLMYRSLLPVAMIVLLLWSFLLWSYREYFRRLFVARANAA